MWEKLVSMSTFVERFHPPPQQSFGNQYTDSQNIAEEGDEIVLRKCIINARRNIEKENLQKQAAKILRFSNKTFTPGVKHRHCGVMDITMDCWSNGSGIYTHALL